MSFVLTLLLGVVTVLFLIYLYFQYKYTYWKRRNVFYIQPKFPYGNFQGLNSRYSIAQIIGKIYSSNEDQKAVGTWIFGTPNLVLRDLELIRRVLIKDFNSFMDRGLIQADSYDPLTG